LLTVSALTAETIAGQNLIRSGGFEADDVRLRSGAKEISVETAAAANER